MQEIKPISLFNLQNQIKSGIKNIFPGSFWIIAEISEMNSNQSGHCYLELIEKATESDQIIAKTKATIWAFTFRMLKPYFESVTGERFASGLKVMLSVSIEFHELYGFSLNIKDIEPNYTIGDLSRKKQEIIKQLQDEGVFHLNKELEFPIVPQRIAVISSETAAGYGDFVHQLKTNHFRYKYSVKLFNAFMQGEEAEKSIIHALETIFDSQEKFDIIVIIRGGGSQADLNCFNSYWLAYHITQFPIPVLTGIGHERDQTITDLVAYNSLKTPTAVAEFIIEKTSEFETYLDELHENFTSLVTSILDEKQSHLQELTRFYISSVKMSLANQNKRIEKYEALVNLNAKNQIRNNQQNLETYTYKIKSVTQHILSVKKQQADGFQKHFSMLIKTQLSNNNQKLANYLNRAHLLNPYHIMKKGYSLTYRNGMLIKSASQLKPGDSIMSKWIDGNAESTIEGVTTE
jgi:exodeoxyribonuclease VII large subunit